MTRADWLELRRTGLGGSDIAAVAGLHPYRRSYDVYAEKVGLVISDAEESEAAFWGQILEPVLCDEYARREQVVLVKPPMLHGLLRSGKDRWMIGSPDRLVEGADRGLEVKMAGLRQLRRWGPEGTDFVPDEYRVQCEWYMALTGYPRWDLAVLLGQTYRCYHLYANDGLREPLIEIGRRFWKDNVEKRVPPPVDHSESSRRLIQALYPENREPLRVADEDEIELARELKRTVDELDTIDRRRQGLLNRLRDRIGVADGIAGPGFRITWRRTKDGNTTDWETAFQTATAMLPMAQRRALIEAATRPRPGMRILRSTFDAGNQETESLGA